MWGNLCLKRVGFRGKKGGKSCFVVGLEEAEGPGGAVGYKATWKGPGVRQGLMGRFDGQPLGLDIHEPGFGS